MSPAAHQFAPFLNLRPLPTRTLYLLLVLVRRVSREFQITEVIPELDRLVERTIAQSRDERARLRSAQLDPETERAAHAIAGRITPHLLRLQRRLDQHRAHPGIEALHQRVLPHGIRHLLGLPPEVLVREVGRALDILSSPAHQPYVQTAGLTIVVRSLGHDHSALQQILRPTQTVSPQQLRTTGIELHHELGLLWIRLMAAAWSESPAHTACRARLLQTWTRCERQTRARRSPHPFGGREPTEQIVPVIPLHPETRLPSDGANTTWIERPDSA